MSLLDRALGVPSREELGQHIHDTLELADRVDPTKAAELRRYLHRLAVARLIALLILLALIIWLIQLGGGFGF